MDLATVIGIVVAFALVLVALFLGGTPGAFFNLPSVLIVVFGTTAVTMICFSLREMMGAPSVIARTLFNHTTDPGDAAYAVMRYAEHARKEGILGLQKGLESASGEPFLTTALTMVVDGTPGEEVERVLRNEAEATAARHMKSASILRKAAEVAPAMGLIGTLIGLVQMLGTLDDPSSIGPAMAVALLTTFYGAILANMVFSPLASKLERNADEERLLNEVYLTAAASIGRQENPRRLEMLLNTILPPAKKLSYFD
jgi:chemotaxis protein MotA